MQRFIGLRALGWAFLLIAGMAAAAAAATQNPAAAPVIKGFVFVPRMEDMKVGGVPEPADQIDTSRVPALSDPAATTEIRRYVGFPINNVLIDSMRTAVAKHYLAIGRPFVNVVVPKQDVTNGVIQVIVIEGRVGQIKIEGNEWFDAEQYRGNLHLQSGEPIDNTVLQADLDWINRNQYRKATAVASEGATMGATNMTIRTQERFPVSVTAGMDNSGNQGTGLYHIYAGFDWGNAFWRGMISTIISQPRLKSALCTSTHSPTRLICHGATR